MDTLTQQYALASLEGTDLTDMVPVLKEIAECQTFRRWISHLH